MSHRATPSVETASRGASRQSGPLPPAKTPVGPGAITAAGVVLSLLVIALGTLAIQSALVESGLVHGTSWLTSVVQSTDRLRPAGWLLPVGVVLILLGLWLLVTALRPRPQTGVALQASTGVFLRPKDVARLAVAAADEVDGVLDAQASATPRKVTVRVTTSGDPGLREAVEQAVAQRLQPTAEPMRVSVTTKAGAR